MAILSHTLAFEEIKREFYQMDRGTANLLHSSSYCSRGNAFLRINEIRH